MRDLDHDRIRKILEAHELKVIAAVRAWSGPRLPDIARWAEDLRVELLGIPITAGSTVSDSGDRDSAQSGTTGAADGAQCAHLRVEYAPRAYRHATWDLWACSECGCEFSPAHKRPPALSADERRKRAGTPLIKRMGLVPVGSEPAPLSLNDLRTQLSEALIVDVPTMDTVRYEAMLDRVVAAAVKWNEATT